MKIGGMRLLTDHLHLRYYLYLRYMCFLAIALDNSGCIKRIGSILLRIFLVIF